MWTRRGQAGQTNFVCIRLLKCGTVMGSAGPGSFLTITGLLNPAEILQSFHALSQPGYFIRRFSRKILVFYAEEAPKCPVFLYLFTFVGNVIKLIQEMDLIPWNSLQPAARKTEQGATLCEKRVCCQGQPLDGWGIGNVAVGKERRICAEFHPRLSCLYILFSISQTHIPT